MHHYDMSIMNLIGRTASAYSPFQAPLFSTLERVFFLESMGMMLGSVWFGYLMEVSPNLQYYKTFNDIIGVDGF